MRKFVFAYISLPDDSLFTIRNVSDWESVVRSIGIGDTLNIKGLGELRVENVLIEQARSLEGTDDEYMYTDIEIVCA